MRREFLQLAHTYQPGKSKIGGWMLSEKLDGTRCFWDGGITRGIPTDCVPWANVINPKTGKPKSKIKPYSTGLWSRYGNPIVCPEWFLDILPPVPLDGELWAGRGNFQLCRSICAGDFPDPRFTLINYAVYGSPPLDCVLQDGEIKNTNFATTIDYKRASKFACKCADECEQFFCLDPDANFRDELLNLSNVLDGEKCFLHPQIQLPQDEQEAREMAERELSRVVNAGGEGVVIRDPAAIWTPKRTRSLLKYKPYQDAEAIITGFTSGRETDKGSKLKGMIGALVTDYKGKRLELSGLTDDEREFAFPCMAAFAAEHPGQEMPSDAYGMHFKIGDTISFRYRELSDDSIPKEARFFRRRDVE
jgi:DNA ligase-1